MNRKNIILLGLFSTAALLLLIFLNPPAPRPRRAARIELSTPESLVKRAVSTQTYTNEQFHQMLLEESDKMGIKDINPTLPSPADPFLGQRLGQQDTRRKAEAVISELGALRQAIDAGRGKPKSIPISGNTPSLLLDQRASSGSVLPDRKDPR